MLIRSKKIINSFWNIKFSFCLDDNQHFLRRLANAVDDNISVNMSKSANEEKGTINNMSPEIEYNVWRKVVNLHYSFSPTSNLFQL